MEKGKFKRKKLNFSIKKEMKIRLIIRIFVIVFISVALSATIFYFYSQREIGSSYRLFHVKADNFLDLLFPAVLLSCLLSTLIGFVLSLFYPHHIAGPLYRIEKDVLRIGEGDLTVNISLRKGDEVMDLAGNINIMVSGLREKIERIKETSGKLKEEIVQEKEENHRIEKLKEMSQKLEEEVSRFRL